MTQIATVNLSFSIVVWNRSNIKGHYITIFEAIIYILSLFKKIKNTKYHEWNDQYKNLRHLIHSIKY